MPDGSTIAIWHIEESEPKLRAAYLTQAGLPEDSPLEVEDYKVARKRKQWFAARLLSYEVIPNFEGLYYDQFGAPHITEDDTCLSFSHSYDKVAIITHPDFAVGIDIQKEDEKLRRIASKFLNDDEQVRFESGGESLDMLQHMWSIKESVFKVHKHHLPFKLIKTGDFQELEQGVMKLEAVRFDGTHNHEVHYHKLDGYYLAHCSYPDS
jgi:4'-phosphopantetheinyl transferase